MRNWVVCANAYNQTFGTILGDFSWTGSFFGSQLRRLLSVLQDWMVTCELGCPLIEAIDIRSPMIGGMNYLGLFSKRYGEVDKFE